MLLIRGGTVLTLDPALGDLHAGEVLIDGERIVAVGPGLESAEAAGAEVIDATGMLVLPGLIDSHTHMWQAPLKGLGAALWGMADYSRHVFPLREKFSAEDMEDATYACGVEMLDKGITTVLDFCHNVMTPAHAERALAAHARTGQRILFGYGMLGSFATQVRDHPWRLEQLRGLALRHRPGLVRLGLALSSPEHVTPELLAREVALGRELGLPMSFHQNPPGQIRALHEAGLLGADIVPVHANLATEDELQALGALGGGISFTPEGEFFGGRSMSIIRHAHRAGVRPSLGVDIPSRVALDLFAQMRLTFGVMRNDEAAEERLAGRWPLARRPGSPHAEPRHMLEYVTVNAAHALGLGDELGRLAPGCLADLLLLRIGPYGVSLGDPAAHVVLQATPADVDTVIVGGRLRKRGGRLTALDPADAAAATRRVRERVLGVAAT